MRFLLSSPRNFASTIKSLFMGGGKNTSETKARNFEIPVQGGFQLTDYVPTLEEYYYIGKEVVCYSNIDEAENLIHYYLKYEAERENIKSAGVEKARSEGAKIIEIDDPKEAANGSHCIVTDTWFSMGDKEDSSKREVLSQFQVTNKLISMADDNVIFLHCLPAHRGEEVDSQVIDGPHSFVWDEAENRLHAQKGIIDWCLNSN